MELLRILLESRPHQVVLSMLIVGVIATIVILIVERKLGRRKKSDQEKIFDLARARNCSEFDIFRQAGESWNFSVKKTEEDFKRYLMSSELPHYVSSYVREQEGEDE